MNQFPFNPDSIRMLADILREKGLSEIELVSRDNRIRVAQGPGGEVSTQADVGSGARVRPPPKSGGAARDAWDVPPAEQPGAVKSPMVGIAYLRPEPEAPPFVTVGQKVKAGQTLMLIEAMKSFTPIVATAAGTVTQILAQDTETVEYDETLMVVE